VALPLKWDAEHPRLYTLRASLEAGGRVVETLTRRVGFRKVERAGNGLLVNGRGVKLRGVNRHEVHSTRGRSLTPELAQQDVLLFREANVNFVRTSHYPPSAAFLDACDRYGMYVEEESAVCFVNTHGNLPTSVNPEYTPNYLNQFAEMIERDRGHPSVIIWSLGNESQWGLNFDLEHRYAMSEDPSRPVIFSYPESVPAGTEGYAIFSMHYADWTDNLGGQSILFPVLHDEFAHVPCYDLGELRRDPGVRTFWGESIRRFGENLFTTEGALGGAIWGGIDDIFQVPVRDFELPAFSSTRSNFDRYGYGQWGIIDGWRRRKPEFWLTKKAFSPVHLDDSPVPVPAAGRDLALPVANRFDHTNLAEIELRWRAGADSGSLRGPDVPPHRAGLVILPERQWRQGEVLNLRFLRAGGLLVDEYNLPVGKRTVPRFPGPRGPAPSLHEDRTGVTVAGRDFSIEFDRRTGLIARAVYRGRTLIEGGPYLHLLAEPLTESEIQRLGGTFMVDRGKWRLAEFSAQADPVQAVIGISGAYGELAASFELRIDSLGLIVTTFTVDSLSGPLPSRGYSEVGVSFTLPGETDRLAWERDALWSAWPSDHIGRAQGEAMRWREGGDETWGVEPRWPWALDMRDFYLNGRGDPGRGGTADFRASRAGIRWASAKLAGSELRVRVESAGAEAVRLEPEGPGRTDRVRLIVNSLWNYPDLAWGNYMKSPVFISPGYMGTVNVRLSGEDERDSPRE
jgi:beta-galactosidase